MNFANAPILVVGDAMLDHYISGDATRVSPEAPVPVVSKKRAWITPGGAANVARGLARLGCEARLAGFAANDAPGQALRRELAADGVACALVDAGSRATTCKTRVLARGQQLLRVDEETVFPPTLEERVALRVNIQNLIKGCKAIIISDYGKGVFLSDHAGENICAEVIKLAREKAIPVLVDPKGVDWEKYAGAVCVTPNAAEFEKICAHVGLNAVGADAKTRRALADKIREKFRIERLLLTRGEKGMTLYEDDSEPLNAAAAKREVADVSGAGDTVIATLAACVAAGESWRESATIANAAAGVAVSKIGATPVSVAELTAALRADADESRVFSLEDARKKIGEWRARGDKIVFTNGCFDLLHPGHARLLNECAALGDRLVVGLNSDASVKRLKGPSRPIQDERSRAILLASQRAVDAVIIFDEDTPEKLIGAVRPDVLAKGSDYAIDQVVGANYVKSYGGQVRLIDLVPGHSTTGLVRRMGEKPCP